ncbi:hypothetical protein NM688_g3159 [Phlebia brevispora]|uniref:Uncharacterized protein n=1 Tax=Phlebia brevispora TaxID=194682 RepID=A0ACC1T6A6_9APHY|nr:hypothetical protein NM688_g3159 [Phlebia brevispora]
MSTSPAPRQPFPPANVDDHIDSSLSSGDDSHTVSSDGTPGKRSEFAGGDFSETPPSGMRLDVKRIKEVWDESKNEYVTQDDASDESLKAAAAKSDEEYAFTISRSYKRTAQPNVFIITTYFHVRSPHFVEAAKEVMKKQGDVAWQAMPLKFLVEEVLAFLPKFEDYLADLKKKDDGSVHPDLILHLDYAIDFLRLEYNARLSELNSLLNEKRITFDLLWGLFVPGSLLLANCGLTQKPLTVRLTNTYMADKTVDEPRRFVLSCERVDIAEGGMPGLSDYMITIPEFHGAKLITDLNAFPMAPYLDPDHEESTRKELIERGRKYLALSATPCHVQYSGIAYRRLRYDSSDYKKVSVKSRIVIDRDMFDIHCHLYSSPETTRDLDGQLLSRSRILSGREVSRRELTEEELMIMPIRLFGFSLADRKWLEFSVCNVEEVVWKPEPFKQLDLPGEKKEIVKALIESHRKQQSTFDDFVEGKGAGLVFNLHGPPGVGKTLTAEATSEVARSPLYMVSGGDLGTTAGELDESLSTIFSLATAWKAVVLIDEADVFLERRSKEDLKRNAMVSVFLRQLEYYPGILILTTNRVDIFDEAIQSRIHVSLSYSHLTADTRERLWRAFLIKAGLKSYDIDALDRNTMDRLIGLVLNGREIKNIVSIASTFASHSQRAVRIEDVLRVIEMHHLGSGTASTLRTISESNKKLNNSTNQASWRVYLDMLYPLLFMLAFVTIITLMRLITTI